MLVGFDYPNVRQRSLALSPHHASPREVQTLEQDEPYPSVASTWTC